MVWMFVMLDPTPASRMAPVSTSIDNVLFAPVPPLTLSLAVKLAVPSGSLRRRSR